MAFELVVKLTVFIDCFYVESSRHGCNNRKVCIIIVVVAAHMVSDIRLYEEEMLWCVL